MRLWHWQSFGKIFRSCRSQMFFKIDILKNFTNFTGKRLWWSLFLIKLQAWMPKRCNENRLQRYNTKKVQHEKSSAWKKCNIKKVQHKMSTAEIMQHEKSAQKEQHEKTITRKKVRHEKSATWKKCNTKWVQHEKKCYSKIVQNEKKSNTEKCNTKNVRHEKSETWK